MLEELQHFIQGMRNDKVWKNQAGLTFLLQFFYPLSVLSLFSSFIFAFEWFWGRKRFQLNAEERTRVFRDGVGRIFPKLLTDISSWLDH